VRAHRGDLAELSSLTGTDASNVLARLDGLDRDVNDLLYWASGGTRDAHETAAPAALASALQQSIAPGS
jgi:hypothetical protein